ncbi:autophagy-related protein 18f-like [Prosopis cineraria]|uniref:autophagy-related protein 18f-like n=1 Tax=Prosopis cineraria TaxID=364024 RepID=UPI00240F8D3C|nr:autophagy-related protein 18f-like [Prosopis cineraria]XP_054792660.1 autophagy-related protein 18f-like [Prosopis cineraria]XP_054812423.1 autophagy-related protein 18f-like [Prosopis cineraria]
MKKDDQKLHQGGPMPRPGRTNGLIPSSFRALSSYLRVVSSGASTVARSAASVASSILDRDSDADHDQVIWAGFDKLEVEGDVIRKVLLLGYRTGFQVWDIEDSKNVQDLVSRHDGPVSFMQMLSKPIASKRSEDKFADRWPLLVVCTDGIFAGGSNIQDGFVSSCNGSTLNCHDQVNGIYLPTTVQFYSLRSQSYVHVLKFRSAIYSVRCSSRVVAVAQSTQVHCFNATTLEREYTLLTNPIVMSFPVTGGIGYGPLSVGPRWLAYSGSPVVVSNSGRVNPQHLTPSASFPGFSSNGSLVAHYAKESSKQLAAGIVTLGDIGYKKLSRYCSELRPDSNGSSPSANSSWKGNGTSNGHLGDLDNIGMVIVRDIVSKSVVAQFRAHKSPISALCFDPSGTILVTASVQGHNINVFKIMPGHSDSLASDVGGPSYVHLYRLQRGFTNAVIQDISFSDDSNWIMISSSRGTSHLFAINPLGGSVNIQSYDASFTSKNGGLGVMTDPAVQWPPNLSSQIPKEQSMCATGPPITLSVVCRIRNGNNGWRSTVSGAAAAATGRTSLQSGVIASSFCNCKGSALYVGANRFKTKYHLLVFSSTGSMIQYALGTSMGQNSVVSGLTHAYESALEVDTRLVVEAIQKWNICQRHNRREREDNMDIYGENGTSDSNKIYPVEMKDENTSRLKLENVIMKVNSQPDEEHHLYFSEAELQTHQAQTPVWAKQEIYFHPMVKEEGILNEESTSEGEIDVERIPTHVIEARAKDLVPIFDYLQPRSSQQTRTPSVNGEVNEAQLHQTSVIHGKDTISEGSNKDSTDWMTNYGGLAREIDSNIVGDWNDHLGSLETNGFVNKNDSDTLEANNCDEVVNNREHLNMEAQLMLVNNDKEGFKKMENHFEDNLK